MISKGVNPFYFRCLLQERISNPQGGTLGNTACAKHVWLRAWIRYIVLLLFSLNCISTCCFACSSSLISNFVFPGRVNQPLDSTMARVKHIYSSSRIVHCLWLPLPLAVWRCRNYFQQKIYIFLQRRRRWKKPKISVMTLVWVELKKLE